MRALETVWPALVQLMVRGPAAVAVAHALAAARVATVAQRARDGRGSGGGGGRGGGAARAVTFAEWAADIERLCAQRKPPGGRLYSAAARLSTYRAVT